MKISTQCLSASKKASQMLEIIRKGLEIKMRISCINVTI